MKLFVIMSEVPNPEGFAVHVAEHELLRGLSECGYQITLQLLFAGSRKTSALTDLELRQLETLKGWGIQILPPLYESTVVQNGRATAEGRIITICRRLLVLQAMYPSLGFRDEVARRVRAARPDLLLLHASSEGLAASFGLQGVTKVAHLGTPDHWAVEARLKAPRLFGIAADSLKDKILLGLERLFAFQYKRAHLKLVRDCTSIVIPDIYAARFYARVSRRRVTYIPAVWIDRYGEQWKTLRSHAENGRPLKIIGSVGHMASTATTFGLSYLGREIIPRLERRMGGRAFEIHLFGPGAPRPSVARALDHPAVKLRGFVQDLGQEILSAEIFLTLNNSGPLQIAHNRVLYAWSLGACVVAHTRDAESYPEMRHLSNALLGETPEELVDLIMAAGANPQLRRRIGEAGRETFATHFVRSVVMPKLVATLEAALQGAPGRSRREVARP